MIRGHAWSETPRKSVELYKRLVGLEAEANGFSYSGFGGGVEYARLVFDGMRERSVASWNSLLAGYMRRPGVELDKVALMAPSSACAKKGT
ncbi:hypothetical protein ACFX10_036110 [Malus domestica]